RLPVRRPPTSTLLPYTTLFRSHIITTPSQSHRPIDIAFVAVPPQQMSEVASSLAGSLHENGRVVCLSNGWCEPKLADILGPERVDRKSTRLNSSHVKISYAVFC